MFKVMESIYHSTQSGFFHYPIVCSNLDFQVQKYQHAAFQLSGFFFFFIAIPPFKVQK